MVAEAEAAVAGGAQLIGLAGGDGSLALVAGVAARHRVPMVVVPAGTRNHLAMDLGLDRSDVTGALDAYGAAVERAVDLGEVNGRPFVNNVSLGLYAEIIRSPAYRKAKLDTTLQRAARPGRALAAGRSTFGSRIRPGIGTAVRTSSRSPTTPTAAPSHPRQPPPSRLRAARGDHAAAAGGSARPGVPRRDRSRPPERLPGFLPWEALTFEVDSSDLVDAGIDGEALRISPPLRFTIRPRALRIRLPQHASELSPTARQQRARGQVRGLLGSTRRAAAPRKP